MRHNVTMGQSSLCHLIRACATPSSSYDVSHYSHGMRAVLLLDMWLCLVSGFRVCFLLLLMDIYIPRRTVSSWNLQTNRFVLFHINP